VEIIARDVDKEAKIWIELIYSANIGTDIPSSQYSSFWEQHYFLSTGVDIK
jgi:hypothetical protein